MSVETYPNLFTLSNDRRAVIGQRIGAMLALSLACHFLLLLLVAGLRLPAKVERPLLSYQVSLVSLPTPQPVQAPPTREPQPAPRVTQSFPPIPKKVDPPQEKPAPQPKETPISVAPKPVPQPTVKMPEPKPAPAPAPIPVPRVPMTPQSVPQPTVKAPEPRPVPVPPPVAIPPQPSPLPMVRAPEPRLVPSAPPPPRKTLDREILRGITLPPEAPKFSDVSPVSGVMPKETPDATTTQRDIKKLLGDLSVPEPSMSSTPPPPKEIARASKATPMRPSVSEELDELNKLNERLQNEYKQRERSEPPRQIAQARPSAPPPPPPQVTKASLRSPATKIQAANSGPGANRYLQLVEQLISRQWRPHQVDPTAESFRVIVKFRLFRNGTIRDLMVEETSGNGYFDDAGKRAVLSAQLPEFPPEMSEQYLDAHFSFLVGEQAG